MLYTANGIAYFSLVALITKNNNERVQLGSFRFMFAVVTNIFMGFAVTGMVEKFGSGAAGWRTTALIFAIVGLVVNTISCLAVKELPEEELSGNTSKAAEEGKAVADEKKHGFAETAKILVHNKYYLMILAIYIVYYIMSNLTTGAGVFCATYYWGDGSLLVILVVDEDLSCLGKAMLFLIGNCFAFLCGLDVYKRQMLYWSVSPRPVQDSSVICTGDMIL